ncbi:MAG: protein kinase [Acidobacteriota bacterium]|nr:protein kinase [Acidobacteriota bacterium]
MDEKQLPSELRRVVEDLLDAHEDAGSFLNEHAVAQLTPSSHPSHARLAVNALLVDRFQVRQFLARGGMGEVYEAEDLELQMPVAIKVVRPEIADYPGAMSRFKREVHLAKQVTHPHVCRIFDLFRHRDPEGGDVIFLSMELLRGQTLAERLRQSGRLSLDEAVTIIRQVASALDAAHSAGILHRDLKPGNIMLEPGRAGDIRAVITDFGMAWSQDANSDQPLTRSGQLTFGTPDYMSPEQIEGKDLSPASDIYSLGLVIYQMITGARAFGGETPLLSVLRRLTESPPPPSRVLPELDRHWDSIVSRCLDQNPTHRFASAADLTAVLDRSTAPLLRSRARPRTRWSSIRSGISTHRAAGLYLVAAFLVVAGAGGLFARLYRRPPRTDSLALVLADFVNTTGEPVFDHTLNVALFAKLQQSPFFDLMPDAKVRLGLRYLGVPTDERLTKDLARQVCLREGGQAVLQGTIETAGNGYNLGLRAYNCATGDPIASEEVAVGVRESALTALDQTADAMRAKLGESIGSIRQYDVALEDASTSSLEALTAYARGLKLTNEKGQMAAEPYFLRAVTVDPEFAIAYARLSSIYADMGESEQARESAIQAYERRSRTSEWERFFILSCYYAFATGELDKEMQTYREWGRIYPHDTVWPTGLMYDYSYFGQFDKAAEMERRQIRNAPETAAAYGNLAQIYLAMERPDEAGAILDQADQAHLHEINLDWERYMLAFYNNNAAGMNAVRARAGAYPGLEETLLAKQAMTEAYFGRMQSARALTQKAMKAALSDGDTETASLAQAQLALWEAEFGITTAARSDASQALSSKARKGSRDVQIIAALAAATAGDKQQAEAWIMRLENAYPLDTLLHQYWLPVIRARMALHQGKPARAIKLLESTAPYETGLMDPLPSMYAVFVRAQAHLAAGEDVQAAADFREMLAHRGLVSNCPIGALSQLGLARALSKLRDVEGSRLAYRDLLVLWRGADPALEMPRKVAADWRALH